MLSRNILMEEEGIGEVTLFHTRCVVNERRVNLTIDESTAVDMASIEVVEKLGLKMAPLERPYTLKWFKGDMKITHWILLTFDLGKYCCAEFFSCLSRVHGVVPSSTWGPMVQACWGCSGCQEK